MIDRDRASAPSSRKQPTGDILYRQGLLTPFEGGLRDRNGAFSQPPDCVAFRFRYQASLREPLLVGNRENASLTFIITTPWYEAGRS